MSTTFDAKVDGGKTAGATSLAWNHTVSAGLINSQITVTLDTGAVTAISPSTVQWDALGTPTNLTQQATKTDPNGNVKTEHWGLKSPASGTKQVKINLASSAEITGGSSSWQYVDQTTTAGFRSAAQSSSGSGVTTISLSVTTVVGDVTISSIGINEATANDTVTAGGGQTLIHQEAVGAATHSGASSYIASASTSQSISYAGWTAADFYAILGSSLKWDGVNPVVGGRTFFMQPSLDGLSSAGPKQFNPSLG